MSTDDLHRALALILERLSRIERNQLMVAANEGRLLSAIGDLTSAVQANTSSQETAIGSLEKQIADLKAQLTPQNDPALDQAFTDIEAQVAQLKTNTQTLQTAAAYVAPIAPVVNLPEATAKTSGDGTNPGDWTTAGDGTTYPHTA